MSVASAAVSAATIYHYQLGIGALFYNKYQDQYIYSFLVDKDTKLEFTDQENTMLAISYLAMVFSIIEIILAFASAKSCSGLAYEPPGENQVLNNNVYSV